MIRVGRLFILCVECSSTEVLQTLRENYPTRDQKERNQLDPVPVGSGSSFFFSEVKVYLRKVRAAYATKYKSYGARGELVGLSDHYYRGTWGLALL